MTTQVITYRLAYDNDTITLCASCVAQNSYLRLGPVQHGLHDGDCDICVAAADDYDDV